MNEQIPTGTDASLSVGRRGFVTLIAAMSGALAGCSVETETARKPEDPANPPGRSDESDAITRVERKLTQVYDQIDEVPVVEDGEFVYDLEDSVERTDYEEMIELAKDALNAAEELDRRVYESKSTREQLQRTAKIAFLLVDQRFLVHRALLGGLGFRQAFSKGDYARSLEVIDEGREMLERLRANGGELTESVDPEETLNLTTSELDAATITGDLEVLLEVLRWWTPVFGGFEYTATGMVAVEEANQELEAERYGQAQEDYGRAQAAFARADAAFNTAHGQGEPLEHLIPMVNDLRCIVPILATGYDDLDEAFSELESSNEEEGREIAGEIMIRLDKEFRRCL